MAIGNWSAYQKQKNYAKINRQVSRAPATIFVTQAATGVGLVPARIAGAWAGADAGRKAWPQIATGIYLWAGDQRLQPDILSIQTPPVGDVEQGRKTALTLGAQLPRDDSAVVFSAGGQLTATWWCARCWRAAAAIRCI